MGNPENVTVDQNGVRRCTIDGVGHVEVGCAQGHNWWRKSQRGRRPEFCPEHAPVEEETETASDDSKSSWEGPTEEEAEVYAKLTGEAKHRIAYYDSQLQKPVYRLNQDEKQTMSFVIPSTHISVESRAEYISERKSLIHAIRIGKNPFPNLDTNMSSFRESSR